ncbi:DUF7144 family membrane protein [Glycomyces harbinensis]|uniref:DUF7144 domain-containing protein n=1 Tax=Glycomyces harbinensis TaxID=58114 RepID=A0A1G7BDK6_9ACTN|nr:hypothetical protein [Glycomyces harbinensis]SDE25194.1 hypothetical protein SAMN05216270_116100 [Glycomyces harbinensis]
MTSRSSNARHTLPAALLLLLGGCWQIGTGVQALATGGYFTAPDGYSFAFSIAAWGWVHLIVGVVAAAVGVALFRGGSTARLLGLALASASLIANFLWLPIEPLWSVALIGLDVVVIWSLATAGGRLAIRFDDGADRT